MGGERCGCAESIRKRRAASRDGGLLHLSGRALGPAEPDLAEPLVSSGGGGTGSQTLALLRTELPRSAGTVHVAQRARRATWRSRRVSRVWEYP